MSPSIVIAGASGYIGRALIPKLLEKFPAAKITALSRSTQVSDDPRVTWKACDLFSLDSIEQALPMRTDLAIYLVHSMGPTAQHDQGSFADYDLILADNFAFAAQKTGLRQLIYLGGIIPENRKLSQHLQSRLEMEQAFDQYKIPSTIFRASLILGESGSSFQILLKLVDRLPLMICPKWTQTLTTPVDLSTVLSAITSSALEEEHFHRVYDLAGCRPITYVEMMQETARKLGKKRFFVTVPFFTPTLSRLWVSLITNTPKDLVYPLIESLEHPMVARPNHLFSSGWIQRSYFDLLDNASLKTQPGRSFFRFSAQRKTVRSVQRLPLPDGRDAAWVSSRYNAWLPRFLAPFIKVNVDGATVTFSVLAKRFVMLQLELMPKLSDSDRQIMRITKGLLVSNKNRGWLEFRVVLNRRFVLTAVHDFRPALPWYVYRFTQAQLHLLVMSAFRKYLFSL